ncbi:hypothetical protein J2X65_005359 [Ancylobacter sp. 3268]|uniref:hypothetical protein n=1 Tax=Ancylobacter sp. 3268 TaxID=2817752 RepID=UPI00285DFB1C|nr:hypothetical protein [Ancylobacter sp. 3268]MDR6955972.1 hypothetical protein [Ancylobacter sp. 3268]
MVDDANLKSIITDIAHEAAQQAFDWLWAYGSADPDNFRRDVRIATINRFLMSTVEPVRHAASERGVTGSNEIHAIWIEAAQAFSTRMRELEGIPASYEPQWNDDDKALKERLHAEAIRAARVIFGADCSLPTDATDAERLNPLNAVWAHMTTFVAAAVNPSRPAEEAIVNYWITEATNVLIEEFYRLRDAWASDEGGRA